MLVRCEKNKLAELSDADKAVPGVVESFGSNDTRALRQYKTYVVYAVGHRGDHQWYYLADENYSSYPFAYPAVLFSVADPKASRHWIRGGDDDYPCDAFEEWALDRYFYDKLTDGEPETVELFRNRKKAMDLESPRAELTIAASALGDGWLMCPECDEVWEGHPADALTQCPKCETLQNNPLWPEQDE